MRRTLLLLVMVLVILPTATIAYRVISLQYPLLPTVPGRVWQLSVRGEVKAGQDGIRLAIAVPAADVARTVLNERIESGALDFFLSRDEHNRVAVWFTHDRPMLESINYTALILVRNRQTKLAQPPIGEYPSQVSPEEQALAMKRVRQWSELAPRARLQAILDSRNHIWQPLAAENRESQAWAKVQKKYGALTTLVILCQAAGLPARTAHGLPLAEGIYTVPLSWVETWTGSEWENVRIATGEILSNPTSLLPLARDIPVLRAFAGSASGFQWTLSRQPTSNWLLHFERITRSQRWLDQWSLFRLPTEFQETFRILLLIPISALLIGVLRNVVGFPTFGTFMPVLMALAFRNTGIVLGLGILALVIAIGYVFRRVLNSMRLLLVPRLSVLLTLVVACLTLVALVGNKIGLREFMAVGLLPIVILTMTIERFFVITEEAGVREGLRTAIGSGAVAAITYEIIHWESLQLTFFVYPELLSVVAALQVLLGRYTGFRLGEISRFWYLRQPS